ncbi:MAG: hypothetical protein PHC88_07080 [Terrimicrobiaceae bacterium]|nr:hypothetical protein [Terrimicrobiaceae bacterium]
MEKTQPLKTVTGTHPLVTMVLFGAIVAALIASGSYVSKQRSSAREAETGLAEPAALVTSQPVTSQ